MIYLFDDLQAFTTQDLERGLGLVGAQRREKAFKFVFEKDRKLSTVAFLLLMFGLRREYGIPEPQELVYSAHNKPLLKLHPDIHFNISHCPKAVACAISSQNVGIDVEEMSQYSQDLSVQVHSKAENEIILSLPHPEDEFCRLWTVKEAILKLTGIGMVDDTRPLIAQYPQIQSHSEIYPDKGYALSYALMTNGTLPLRMVSVDEIRLFLK
ncbi:MAG: 4'-phosphopantetheinyl transferase superfamily protein [Bacteroidales bacterium]|nr:4'-phosphopantetheinyl transferase superfamily protein [Bacteroidales bacterium]